MEIVFHRPARPRRPYRSVAVRDDGVALELAGATYHNLPPLLPHDLAHFVVEDRLGLTHGLWSVIARGGLFPQCTVVAGRQRARARERGRALVKEADAGARLTQAEVLVGRFVAAACAGRGVVPRMDDRWAPAPVEPRRAAATCEALREAATDSDALADGATLTRVWRLR
jgi:hypothetical protein